MIHFDFIIEEYPHDLSKSYSLVAYTEGRLAVRNDNDVLFNECGILLVELLVSLNKWLKTYDSNSPSSFYYASMDFEEEPILAFEYCNEMGKYKFISVWSKKLNVYISIPDIISASKTYIEKLKEVLVAQFKGSDNVLKFK